MLKVCWDTSLSERNLAGTGVYARELLAALSVREDVAVVSTGGWGAAVATGGRVGRALRAAADIAWTQLGLPLHYARHEFDVLHLPALPGPAFVPHPSVVTVFDTAFLHFPEHYASWWIGYLRVSLPHLVRSADAVLTISDHSKSEIVNAFDVRPERVHAIPLGVNHRRFEPSAQTRLADVLPRYGLSPGYVLHVGSLVRRKNVPLLLDAVALLVRSGLWRDRKVVIAGGAAGGMPGSEEIRRTIVRLNLQTQTCMLGHVSDEDLPALYAGAAVLAAPSEYEGFGLPLLEAMAIGTPVLASHAASFPEVVGQAGLLVAPGDVEAFATGLSRITEDHALRKSLIVSGLARAATFTWNRTADETVRVYQAVAR